MGAHVCVDVSLSLSFSLFCRGTYVDAVLYFLQGRAQRDLVVHELHIELEEWLAAAAGKSLLEKGQAILGGVQQRLVQEVIVVLRVFIRHQTARSGSEAARRDGR